MGKFSSGWYFSTILVRTLGSDCLFMREGYLNGTSTDYCSKVQTVIFLLLCNRSR